MYKELEGHHAYFAYPDYVNPYLHLNVLVQLASAMYWKKHFGTMHITCNLAHLETLQMYGVDSVYDSVNLTMLDGMSSFDMRYWSLCKMHLANKLADTKQRFVIMDTDLWLRGVPELFDLDKDVLGLHEESFREDDAECTYPDPTDFISEKDASEYDWSHLPINAGVLYFNNPKLVKEWYAFAMSVIERNRDRKHPKSAKAVETIFIEQRSLPAIAAKGNYTVGTLIPSVYHTNLTQEQKDTNYGHWQPPFNSSVLMDSCFNKIKHVWGLKNSFGDPKVRKLLATLIITNLEEDGIDLSRFSMLIKDNIV